MNQVSDYTDINKSYIEGVTMFYYTGRGEDIKMYEELCSGIFISRESIDIILKNVYCRKHFLLLASLVKKVIFCGLTQGQKQKIVPEIKKGMGNSVLLGLGSEDYDIPLLVSSDISICIESTERDNKPLIVPGVADIVIQGISLPELIFTHGYRIREHLNSWSIIFLYYTSTVGFYFIISIIFTQSKDYPIGGAFEFQYFFRIVSFFYFPILFPVFLFRPAKETLMCFPSLYSKGRKKFMSLSALVICWTASFFSSLILFISCNFLLQGIGYNGKEIDLHLFTSFAYMPLSWLAIGPILMVNLHIKSSISLCLLFAGSILSIYSLFIYKPQFSDNDPFEFLSHAASHSPAILLLFLIFALLFIHLYFSQCFPLLCKEKQKTSNISLINKKIVKYGALAALKTENIPVYLSKDLDKENKEESELVSRSEFLSVISTIFENKNESAIEPYLEQLLNSTMIWEAHLISYITLLIKDAVVTAEYYTLFAPFHFAQFRIAQLLFVISNQIHLLMGVYNNENLADLIAHYSLDVCLLFCVIISFHSSIHKRVEKFSYLVS